MAVEWDSYEGEVIVDTLTLGLCSWPGAEPVRGLGIPVGLGDLLVDVVVSDELGSGATTLRHIRLNEAFKGTTGRIMERVPVAISPPLVYGHWVSATKPCPLNTCKIYVEIVESTMLHRRSKCTQQATVLASTPKHRL